MHRLLMPRARIKWLCPEIMLPVFYATSAAVLLPVSTPLPRRQPFRIRAQDLCPFRPALRPARVRATTPVPSRLAAASTLRARPVRSLRRCCALSPCTPLPVSPHAAPLRCPARTSCPVATLPPLPPAQPQGFCTPPPLSVRIHAPKTTDAAASTTEAPTLTGNTPKAALPAAPTLPSAAQATTPSSACAGRLAREAEHPGPRRQLHSHHVTPPLVSSSPHAAFVASPGCATLLTIVPPSRFDARTCHTRYHPQHFPCLQRTLWSFFIAEAAFFRLPIRYHHLPSLPLDGPLGRIPNTTPTAPALSAAALHPRPSPPPRPRHPQRHPTPPLKPDPGTHHERDAHNERRAQSLRQSFAVAHAMRCDRLQYRPTHMQHTLQLFPNHPRHFRPVPACVPPLSTAPSTTCVRSVRHKYSPPPTPRHRIPAHCDHLLRGSHPSTCSARSNPHKVDADAHAHPRRARTVEPETAPPRVVNARCATPCVLAPPSCLASTCAAPRTPVGTPIPFPVHRAAVSSPLQGPPPMAYFSVPRYRLLDYFYTAFHEASLQGTPVVSPL
ncbi:hypothetical protein B0H14DRAFT_3449021 [Mycena olivaceomarginata]|nr:hypothetical protein B0H14DRAFT_3449021 [Mycena olivaceomarginata]